jgi:hypothetical protein
MRLLCAAVIFISTQIHGCKRSDQIFTTSEVLGLYVCNVPGSAQSVELRRDGTFVQSIGADAKRTTYSGKWALVNSADGFTVELEDYHFEWPSGVSSLSGPGIWNASARRTRDGNILLMISEDDGLYCILSNQRT